MITALLLYAGYSDYKTRRIPDAVVLILYLAAIFLSKVPTIERIVGFLIPALPLFFVALKTDKLKGGDVKFLSAAGAFYGIYGLAVILGIATPAAVIYSMCRKEKSVPLAAFMAVGGVVFTIIQLWKGGSI